MPQRRAEALVSLCRQYLASHDDGGPGPRRGLPHLSVVADIGAITGITDDLLAALRAEAAHVGRLSRSTLERIACDCQVSRILTDGPSQVIDVGRATRTISPALWKALVARDHHCTHPGCKRGPAYCEGHHIIHWSQGGATSVEAGALLCGVHHTQIHDSRYGYDPRPHGKIRFYRRT